MNGIQLNNCGFGLFGFLFFPFKYNVENSGDDRED